MFSRNIVGLKCDLVFFLGARRGQINNLSPTKWRRFVDRNIYRFPGRVLGL